MLQAADDQCLPLMMIAMVVRRVVARSVAVALRQLWFQLMGLRRLGLGPVGLQWLGLGPVGLQRLGLGLVHLRRLPLDGLLMLKREQPPDLLLL